MRNKQKSSEVQIKLYNAPLEKSAKLSIHALKRVPRGGTQLSPSNQKKKKKKNQSLENFEASRSPLVQHTHVHKPHNPGCIIAGGHQDHSGGGGQTAPAGNEAAALTLPSPLLNSPKPFDFGGLIRRASSILPSAIIRARERESPARIIQLRLSTIAIGPSSPPTIYVDHRERWISHAAGLGSSCCCCGFPLYTSDHCFSPCVCARERERTPAVC